MPEFDETLRNEDLRIPMRTHKPVCGCGKWNCQPIDYYAEMKAFEAERDLERRLGNV